MNSQCLYLRNEPHPPTLKPLPCFLCVLVLVWGRSNWKTVAVLCTSLLNHQPHKCQGKGFGAPCMQHRSSSSQFEGATEEAESFANPVLPARPGSAWQNPLNPPRASKCMTLQCPPEGTGTDTAHRLQEVQYPLGCWVQTVQGFEQQQWRNHLLIKRFPLFSSCAFSFCSNKLQYKLVIAESYECQRESFPLK